MPLTRYDVVDTERGMIATDDGAFVRYADIHPLLMAARRDQDAANEFFTTEDAATCLVMPALPLLQRMLTTYRNRRASYGPSEQRFADIALAFFPDGLRLDTRSDWVRFGLFVQIMSKMARYTHDFHAPHVDSMHDIGPYAAMLEAEDRRLRHLPPFEMHSTDLK